MTNQNLLHSYKDENPSCFTCVRLHKIIQTSLYPNLKFIKSMLSSLAPLVLRFAHREIWCASASQVIHAIKWKSRYSMTRHSPLSCWHFMGKYEDISAFSIISQHLNITACWNFSSLKTSEWLSLTAFLGTVGIKAHIDGLVQDCSNSIANSLELLQSCTKPSI